MQEKSWEIKEIPTWVSQKEASALIAGRRGLVQSAVGVLSCPYSFARRTGAGVETR